MTTSVSGACVKQNWAESHPGVCATVGFRWRREPGAGVSALVRESWADKLVWTGFVLGLGMGCSARHQGLGCRTCTPCAASSWTSSLARSLDRAPRRRDLSPPAPAKHPGTVEAVAKAVAAAAAATPGRADGAVTAAPPFAYQAHGCACLGPDWLGYTASANSPSPVQIPDSLSCLQTETRAGELPRVRHHRQHAHAAQRRDTPPRQARGTWRSPTRYPCRTRRRQSV